MFTLTLIILLTWMDINICFLHKIHHCIFMVHDSRIKTRTVPHNVRLIACLLTALQAESKLTPRYIFWGYRYIPDRIAFINRTSYWTIHFIDTEYYETRKKFSGGLFFQRYSILTLATDGYVPSVASDMYVVLQN